MHLPRKLLAALAAFLALNSSQASEKIDVFDFNSPVPDSNPSTGTFASDSNLGLLGWGQNTTGVIVNGVGSTDPNIFDNSAFGMIGFSTNPLGPDKTEGFGFALDTIHFKDINLTLDIKFTPTSVDRLQVQYFYNAAWYDFTIIQAASPGWINSINLDFSNIPIFPASETEMRLVRKYANDQGFQAPGGGPYSGGMIAFDNVIIRGTALPEPTAFSMLAVTMGLTLILAVKRRDAAYRSKNRT
jgi:hypothetical protein